MENNHLAAGAGFVMLISLLGWVIRKLFSEMEAARKSYVQSLAEVSDHNRKVCNELRECIEYNRLTIVENRHFLDDAVKFLKQIGG